ncbi:MAG: hypothetical protein ACE5L7_06940 [Candidatus Aminicenantales bacterium]
MKNKEVIDSKKSDDESEAKDVPLKERIEGISQDSDEKKKMEEGEYPVDHRFKRW